MTLVIKVPAGADYYRGSGHAVAAVINGHTVDAVYGVDLSQEARVRDQMRAKHPGAGIAAGMMSCYEFVPYDPSEIKIEDNEIRHDDIVDDMRSGARVGGVERARRRSINATPRTRLLMQRALMPRA